MQNLRSRDDGKVEANWSISEVGILLPILALGPFSVGMTLSAYGLIIADLDGDASGWQVSFTTFFFGYALGQMTFGLMADFYGRKCAVLNALLLFSFTSLLCANATNMEELAIYRFSQAIGAGAGPLLVRVMLRDKRSTSGAAQWISVFGSAHVLLQFVALSFGAMTAQSLGWRLLFVDQAVLGIGLALIFAYWTRGAAEPKPGQRRMQGFFTEYAVAMVDIRSLRNVLPLSFISAGVLTLTTSSPTVLIGQFAASPKIYSLQFAAISLATVMGMFCNRYLIRRFSLHNVTYFATVGATIGCGAVLVVVIVTGASEVAFVLACMAFTFCSGFVIPNGVIRVMGDDGRCFAGRAAVAGVVEYLIVAGVIFLSSILGSSAKAVLSLLVGLTIIALMVQLRPGMRASNRA